MKQRKIAVVTGASRGAGKGIALALGAAGWRVYVTGRSQRLGDADLPGTIYETAEQVSAAGGEGIAVRVDHGRVDEVAALFDRVSRDSGPLNLLINNATTLHDDLVKHGPFWEKSIDLVNILDVGLRSHYVASWFAAKLMVPARRGLIVFTSSFGSVCYMHGPAYGAQKAGVDKFAADMAVDLREFGVAAVSVWMGPLITERSRRTLAAFPEQYTEFMKRAETPEFTGRLAHALYEDPALMDLSGQTLIGAELAERYDIRDIDGSRPPSFRKMLGEPRVPHPAIVR